jgi:hypothetical protein
MAKTLILGSIVLCAKRIDVQIAKRSHQILLLYLEFVSTTGGPTYSFSFYFLSFFKILLTIKLANYIILIHEKY